MATSASTLTNPAEPEALKLAFGYLVNSIDTSSLLPAALSKGLISSRIAKDRKSQWYAYKVNLVCITHYVIG